MSALNGQIAVITGGAQGIGKAVVGRVARRAAEGPVGAHAGLEEEPMSKLDRSRVLFKCVGGVQWKLGQRAQTFESLPILGGEHGLWPSA